MVGRRAERRRAGVRWLGAVTPLAGAAFITGWLLPACGIYRA